MTIKRINFRVDDTDHRRYMEAAVLCGYASISDYLRECCEALVARAVVAHGDTTVAERLGKNAHTCAQP